MDGKNVLMAIVLSTLVLVFWATFFEPPPVEKQIVEDQISKSEDPSSPSIEKIELSKKERVLVSDTEDESFESDTEEDKTTSEDESMES